METGKSKNRARRASGCKEWSPLSPLSFWFNLESSLPAGRLPAQGRDRVTWLGNPHRLSGANTASPLYLRGSGARGEQLMESLPLTVSCIHCPSQRRLDFSKRARDSESNSKLLSSCWHLCLCWLRRSRQVIRWLRGSLLLLQDSQEYGGRNKLNLSYPVTQCSAEKTAETKGAWHFPTQQALPGVISLICLYF